jgi:predicted RND superfamily exporter protein
MSDQTDFQNPDTVLSSLSSRLFARLGELILGRRWLWVILLACITIVAVFGMRMLRFDNSNEVWFVENDPSVKLLDKFRTIFGNEDFVVLLFEYDFDQLAGSETPKFMGLCLVIQMLLLTWLGRGVRGVAVPITIVVISIVWTMGAVGWIGFSLNTMIIILPSLLICVGIGDSIIVGVAVDDTIHFFRRYRREFKACGTYADALESTLATVGRPITFTTLTLILGFAVMILSVMKGWSHFGFLAGFAFFWALLADFFFAPALMLLFKPLGPERAENASHFLQYRRAVST